MAKRKTKKPKKAKTVILDMPKGGFNPKAFGLACGILWGIIVFIMTLIASYTAYGSGFLVILESVYPYYLISIPGAFIGLIYGFIDGFIGGAVFAWLYNKFL